MHTQQAEAPAADFYIHAADCATCRGALLVIMAHVMATRPAAERPRDSQHSEEDLPAFIEYEASRGWLAAISHYPHVWSALLHDADLAETYYLTRTLLSAEQQGELADMRQVLAAWAAPAPSLPRHLSLRLKRDFFNRALLLLPPSLVREHGADQGETLVVEKQTDDGLHLSLSVQQRPDDTWDVTMMVDPLRQGWLVLTLGETVLRAPFNEQGVAVVAQVPGGLIAMTDGPDLVVDIETDEAAS